MTFLDMLRAAERQNASMLCVGLDPEPTKFPDRIKGDSNKIYDFCAAIVDATADVVNSFKPHTSVSAIKVHSWRRVSSGRRVPLLSMGVAWEAGVGVGCTVIGCMVRLLKSEDDLP